MKNTIYKNLFLTTLASSSLLLGMGNSNAMAIEKNHSLLNRKVSTNDIYLYKHRDNEILNSQKYPQIIAQSTTVCKVINIKSGVLTLRYTPNGAWDSGLHNGNTVRYLYRDGIWFYVTVNDARSRLFGLQGWVNSNYLTCYYG